MRSCGFLFVIATLWLTGGLTAFEQTIKDNFVGSHTFRFISPVLTQQFGIPHPCTSCHADKSNEWALKELRTWPNTSPWRVAE